MSKKLDVKQIPKETSITLNNISKDRCITKCELLRPAIRQVVNSYPEDMKTKKNITFTRITVTGVSDKLMEELEAIAYNLGRNKSDLVKDKITEIIANKPSFI